MKSNYLFLFAFIGSLLISSCAKNIVLNYTDPSPLSGKIVIRPTSPVYANFVINDSLFVKYKYVKSITINNVPRGNNSIHFSGDSYNLKEALDYKAEIEVLTGTTKTELITTPPQSNGYWLYKSTSVFVMIGYLVWLFYLP